MVEWLAGNRIRGTSTERASADFNNHLTGVGAVGGWKEVGRTTLGSAGDTIQVSSLPDKRYYMLLCDDRNSGSINVGHRAGEGTLDTGSNYSKRASIDGATDLQHVNQNNFLEDALNHSNNMFMVNYISSVAGKEKLGIGSCIRQNSAGAGNAPARTEYVGKWANTANVIDTLATVNFGTGDLAIGSELVVLGWDEDDTHTDNFWEELASVELTGTADTISSGTITAKKYLWVQFYQKSSGACNIQMTFNNDTGSNYARRGSNDGGSDFTSTSASILQFQTGDTDSAHFFNMFIVNNSANEKLGISHGVTQNTAGAGTATERKEQVHKWANTSAQITEIDIDNTDSGSYASGTIMKVWGSD
tara:strand:- start:5351 stop:6433 length:1083 start_codon:yes stop_codon:yes gene_type:complete